MKVADIIKTLEEYDPNDSVVIAWWDSDIFDPDLVGTLSSDDWEAACDSMEEIDWSYTFDRLEDVLGMFLKENK